ncbi:phospholipase [Humibacter ginsenosidimutans]|uniref:aggregation-promoting factor C-terminal-like domain-containing protein n=1 Tax=Humibacter ginsenosidimutans TaxID=2599293 RepID=UPI001FEF060B|nr:phospholipase [Humibacter ginsenosidimutans]
MRGKPDHWNPLTFLTRITPTPVLNTINSLSGKAVAHKRALTVSAAAVLAVATVVTPVVVQSAYAEPAKASIKTAATEVAKGSPIAPMTVSHKAAQASFNALAVAQITAEQVKGRADLTQLDAAIDALQNNYSSDPGTLHTLTVSADDAVVDANKAAIAHDAAVAAAQKAAAEAAAQKAAAARAAAAALARVNTPSGAQAVAQSMAASRYGWGGDQFSCLVSLWNRESGWNYQAYNAGSGATGIPQALPGSKMASAGGDWATNAATQISWGLGYIAGSYGTPCGAWGHSQSYGWY